MSYQDNLKRMKARRAAAESGAGATATPKAASTKSKKVADDATEEVKTGRSFLGKVGVFCKWASIPTAIALIVFLYFFVPMWQEAGQKLEGKTIQDLFQMESAEAGVVTQDGKVLAVLGEKKPDFVPYEKINQKAKDALLAVEDRSFFSFWRLLVPFDPIGILRAGYTDVKTGEVRAGGSTIIQMLARTLFVGREKTLKRKLRELAYSYQLIIRYKREDLLAVFMNRADFGAVNGQKVVGFMDASRAFYRVELDQLTPDQLATVVGVLNATTAFNPVYHPAASKIRRNVVLAAWEDAGFISSTERATLAGLPVQANPRDIIKKYGDYPNAVKAALAELEEVAKQLKQRGIELPPQEELRIEVTYDSVVLEAWRQAFLDEEKNLPAGTKAAGGVIDYRNGETLAMFGGTDFLNRFTSAQRQPGSVFKLFVYALALAKGKVTPDTVFTDEARVFKNPGSKDYAPENHDGFSGQQMTVAQALASSNNVIACVVAEQV
ncbi:MAG: transglycosylase domain-containing protein, partial [Candidatus Doudnabacteria bacterium]|nr:transglycosylase domain-containing protein [Candidatus Doudnabacteria bacterium]